MTAAHAGTVDLYGQLSVGSGDLIDPQSLPPCDKHCHGHGFALPLGNLIYSNNSLYGVLSDGGRYGHGSVFSIALPSGQVTTLYDFKGGLDGARPFGTLTLLNGVLYGTTLRGGFSCKNLGCGTVFAVTGAGQEKIVHRFLGKPDGADPLAGLTAVDGVLYGTTAGGGQSDCGNIFNQRHGCGTIFRIASSGQENVLYSFTNTSSSSPHGDLLYSNGVLYGTTIMGRAGFFGSVFAVKPSGEEQSLFQFGTNRSGRRPDAGLTLFKGKFFGTTYEGGFPIGYRGCGGVFSIDPSGNEKSVYLFKEAINGCNPLGDLVEANGSLYGTTSEGGASGFGCIFEIDAMGRERVVYSLGYGDGFLSGLTSVSGTLYAYASSGLVTVRP